MAEIEFENVTKRYPDGTVAVNDLTLTVADGEFLILVGASGCGKSTALRSVAGLEQISEGAIRIDGEVVNDVAPPDRDVAMVFQSYALYPHLTVQRNIAFPLRMARMHREERDRRVLEAARLLGIEPLLQRKPGELSGGQRQRVAMGRAIVRQPRAFLMDEPLSNLDAKLRVQMRAELVNLHRRLGTTILYVTHDQVEAMTLGDRVAVMRDGVVQQVDGPKDLYSHPVNTYVAAFLGSPPMNFLNAHVAAGSVKVGQASVQAASRWGQDLGPVLVGVRPEDVTLASGQGAADRDRGEDDGALIFPAAVEIVEDLGAEKIVYVHLEDDVVAEIAERPVELGGTLGMRLSTHRVPAVGERVEAKVDLADAHLFDPETGLSLL